jgi:predicted transcriptional regulator
MMKVLEIAFEKLKALPEDRQAYAAEVIEQIAASDDGVFRIPDAHCAGVRQGLEQAERGELVSDEDMAALWKQCGL